MGVKAESRRSRDVLRPVVHEQDPLGGDAEVLDDVLESARIRLSQPDLVREVAPLEPALDSRCPQALPVQLVVVAQARAQVASAQRLQELHRTRE